MGTIRQSVIIKPRTVLALTITKLFFVVIKLFRLGSGSTWPGEIALYIEPQFISQLIKHNPKLKTVVVTGTNGKTTTVRLLEHILRHRGQKVFSNTSGANLINGIASSLIFRTSLSGKINYDTAVFEVDENTLPLVLDQFHPDSIILLDLFRDQLDRYGEIDSVVKRWEDAIAQLSRNTTLIMNGQDPNIFYLGQRLSAPTVIFFGLNRNAFSKKTTSADADVLYCPTCSRKLAFQAVAYSHVGQFSCPHCGDNCKLDIESQAIKLPHLTGLFNAYNILAASSAALKIFDIPLEQSHQFLKDFQPAFGRQEVLTYRGRELTLQLSKNPAGMNQSINLAEEAPKTVIKQVMFILNSEIPDGLDISWIWDVDFESLVRLPNIRLGAAGSRAYDLATRLKTASADTNTTTPLEIKVDTNPAGLLDTLISESSIDDKFFIFPVYSAMLDIRQHIAGQRIRKEK